MLFLKPGGSMKKMNSALVLGVILFGVSLTSTPRSFAEMSGTLPEVTVTGGPKTSAGTGIIPTAGVPGPDPVVAAAIAMGKSGGGGGGGSSNNNAATAPNIVKVKPVTPPASTVEYQLHLQCVRKGSDSIAKPTMVVINLTGQSLPCSQITQAIGNAQCNGQAGAAVGVAGSAQYVPSSCTQQIISKKVVN